MSDKKEQETTRGFDHPNIAGRKIAIPKRRLQRSTSDHGGTSSSFGQFGAFGNQATGGSGQVATPTWSFSNTLMSKESQGATTAEENARLSERAAATDDRTKLRHGRSPLSQSWSANDEEEQESAKAEVSAGKKRDASDIESTTQGPSSKVAKSKPSEQAATPFTSDKQKDKDEENKPAERHVSFKLPEPDSKGKEAESKEKQQSANDEEGQESAKAEVSTGKKRDASDIESTTQGPSSKVAKSKPSEQAPANEGTAASANVPSITTPFTFDKYKDKETATAAKPSPTIPSTTTPFTFDKHKDKDKENKPAERHVSFKLPEPDSKGKEAESKEKQQPVSPFKPLPTSAIKVTSLPATAPTTQPQSTSKDIFGPPAPVTTEQTIIESKITGPEHIERRTRYNELPAAARAELNELAQFIQKQMDLAKEIQTRQLADSRECISETQELINQCNREMRLLKEQHQAAQSVIEGLMQKADYQLTNAVAAKLFCDDGGQKRTFAMKMHNKYFNDLAKNLRERCEEYRLTINEIERAIQSMMADHNHAPRDIPQIMKLQGQTLIALAAKVAELHESAQKLKENVRGILAP